MSFYGEKKVEELLGINKEPSSAEKYIERCAQNIVASVIRDKQKGVPPKKAIAHMMAKFYKVKRRNPKEPKKLEAIRQRIIYLLKEAPEMQVEKEKKS